MTAEDFLAWRKSLSLNRSQAAKALGVGRNQPQRYEDGQPIPLYIALACAAIARGIRPWPE